MERIGNYPPNWYEFEFDETVDLSYDASFNQMLKRIKYCPSSRTCRYKYIGWAQMNFDEMMPYLSSGYATRWTLPNEFFMFGGMHHINSAVVTSIRDQYLDIVNTYIYDIYHTVDYSFLADSGVDVPSFATRPVKILKTWNHKTTRASRIIVTPPIISRPIIQQGSQSPALAIASADPLPERTFNFTWHGWQHNTSGRWLGFMSRIVSVAQLNDLVRLHSYWSKLASNDYQIYGTTTWRGTKWSYMQCQYSMIDEIQRYVKRRTEYYGLNDLYQCSHRRDMWYSDDKKLEGTEQFYYQRPENAGQCWFDLTFEMLSMQDEWSMRPYDFRRFGKSSDLSCDPLYSLMPFDVGGADTIPIPNGQNRTIFFPEPEPAPEEQLPPSTE